MQSKLTILLALGFLGWPVVHGSSDDGRIIPESELLLMDRENALWRLVRVDLDVDANLQIWRSKGFTFDEIESLKPRLTEIWTVEASRNFGWLSTETSEKIKAVDQVFTAKMRAFRLFDELGIQTEKKLPARKSALNRDWQRAIQHELDYGELKEFRLLNSKSAQAVAKLGEGLNFNVDEFRTLCTWQREFEDQHRAESAAPGRIQKAGYLEDFFDYRVRIRSLLGDRRFAVYLARTDSDFARMAEALASLEGITPTLVLDLWSMKVKRDVGNARASDPTEWRRQKAKALEGAKELLGEVRFAHYVQDETAGWLR